MESVSNTPHTTSEDGNLRGPLAGPYNEQGCQTCENPPLDPPSEPTVPPPPQRSATRQLLHYDTKTKPGTHSAWPLTDSFLSCSFLRRGPSARVIGQERKKQHKTTTRKAWEEKRVGIKRTWHPRVGEGGHHWPDTQGLGRMATTDLTPKGWGGWPPPTWHPRVGEDGHHRPGCVETQVRLTIKEKLDCQPLINTRWDRGRLRFYSGQSYTT